ncbi:MAG: stage II sporulation protein M [Treponema sp.]|jgi:uncharacterized membrane protein SpoIIM required for sporulation|nr:stage II sporulation protein M [Treponema sp.]
MTEQAFIQRREQSWKRFEGIVYGGKGDIKKNAAWFPRAYRELTVDLNTARAQDFDPALIERLNRLVPEGNQILYEQHSWSVKALADFILRVFPRTIRSHWRSLGAVLFLFYGVIFFFCYLVIRFPSLAYDIIPESQVEMLESMYDPEGSHFLVPRDVSSDADMFGFYIYNNVSIAFRIFAGGILAGFGSLLVLVSNAVFLGTAAGHIINRGFGSAFFSFIIGHSSFELTAIVLSAQGGLLLGYRFFVPQGLSRAASLRRAGKTAIPLISGSALLLVLAAVIEAFWSSRHELPAELRYGAGIAGWVLLFFYVLCAGRTPAGSAGSTGFTGFTGSGGPARGSGKP